jgi:RNA polymerase sigma-70 factor (ECF subfamily)
VTSDPRTDEELIAAFVASTGHVRDNAFNELVDRYERRVYGICYRYFGDHADAQDATQETLLTILRRAASFRGDSKLSTWVYRVTVNVCNDLARKRARRPQTPVEDVGELAGDALALEDEAIGATETVMQVQRALGQLDELSRTLLILVAIEGQGYREVAEALDLPVGTVKSRVHRARAQMAVLLEEEPADPARGSGPQDAPATPSPRRRSARGPPE